jgi:hypothetical protein
MKGARRAWGTVRHSESRKVISETRNGHLPDPSQANEMEVRPRSPHLVRST